MRTEARPEKCHQVRNFRNLFQSTSTAPESHSIDVLLNARCRVVEFCKMKSVVLVWLSNGAVVTAVTKELVAALAGEKQPKTARPVSTTAVNRQLATAIAAHAHTQHECLRAIA